LINILTEFADNCLCANSLQIFVPITFHHKTV